ncbi:helix-turn-helix domain-containing protein [Glutamicibacter mishrai]|uniref:TetR/AcrR family transcriptional regulator n=1 Tax=Glutamicibacter mishrai TaxID=1775880 RepID=UPI0032EC3ECE
MRSDALRRRETILSTARELFAQHGANIAMDLIAERSNVGIGTLYRNFASRAELIEEVTVTTLQEVLDASTSAEADLAGEPQAWTEFLENLVKLNLGALSEALGAALPSTLSERVLHVQRECAQAVRRVLELAKGYELVREDLNAVELVTAIGAATRPLPRPFKDQAPQLQERLVQLMLDGFRPHVVAVNA